MNPFLNPITGIPLIKNVIFDPGRLKRFNPKKIEKYRNKAFRKLIKYAYTIPLYHKKYKAAGIHPEDIKGIEDIVKLPFITKQDLVEHFPNDVVPPKYNKKNAQVICTGGSTGKPISIYSDFSVFAGGVGAPIRFLRSLNLDWKKTKVASIGTFDPNRADNEAQKAIYSKIPVFKTVRNRLSVNAFNPIKDVMKQLDAFQPDLILTYPVTFQNLAYLKNKGYGKNVKPKIIQSSGYTLDEYIKEYSQDAFGCQMVNVYGSVESYSESPVAYECLDGTWHINYDYFHLETIDKNMDVVGPNKRGHIVLTRLFGKCEPIIRYTGMDDWVTLTPAQECICGLTTPTFKDGVEGRISSSIILPDGRIYPGASFAVLSLILNELKTRKVTQFQIIQKKIDEIEILIIIDEDLRDEEPSVDFLFKKIEEVYKEKVGPDVSINVKEVKEIKSNTSKPAPLVKSNLTEEDREKVLN